MRRVVKRTAKSAVKTPSYHTVEGYKYKTKSIADLHKEWSKDTLVKSFSLPTVKDSEKKSKYGALKAEVNGFIFDSVMEARYYVYLLHERRSKRVTDIKLQQTFELMPSYTDENTGKKVRPITYIADFTFQDTKTKKIHVVDVKGTETPEFKIKWKLLGFVFPEYVRECVQWRASLGRWLDMDEIKKVCRSKKLQKAG